MNKLNLGAGNFIEPGYINHDIRKHRPEIDICFDLNGTDWTDLADSNYKRLVEENQFDEIKAWDVIEHLDDPVNFMNNCWNILEKEGRLKMKACGWQNPNYWVDITHKKGYDIKSFDYFDPDTAIGKEYGYYTEKRWKIIEKHYDARKNVIIELEPRK